MPEEYRKRDFDITIRVGGYVDTPDKREITKLAEIIVEKLQNDIYHVGLQDIKELEGA